MSLKDTDVRTPGDKTIAKKFKLSLAKVRGLVDVGANHEKEHNTNLAKAKEVARDHIGERPDYYKMLAKAEKTDKNIMKENATQAVRGLGSVTGSPAGVTDYVANYINTNAMSYNDDNGDKLKYMNQSHFNLHSPSSSSYGSHNFNPTSQNGRLASHVPGPARLGKRKKKKLNEMGEYDNKGGTVGAEGLTDAAPSVMRKKDVKEQGVGIRSYTEKPLVEKKPIPDAMPTGSDRGIYEGWASIGHAYDWAGDRNSKAKFFGKKPKPTTTKGDEKDDTYKDSKQGGKVKLTKPVKEELSMQDIAARREAADSSKTKDVFNRMRTGTPKGVTDLSPKQDDMKEAAVDIAPMQHMDSAKAGEYRSARASSGRVSMRGSTAHVKGASFSSGTGSARATVGAAGQMKPTTTNVPFRGMRSVSNAKTTQGAGGQLKPSSTSGSSSFTPNSQSRSMSVGKSMGMSKQTSPVVKGMSAAGSEASKKIVPKAASVIGTVGKAARALSGPEGAAATAAAEPLAKKMAASYKAGHQSMTPHGDEGEKASSVFARMKQPSQGRSVSQYEKDVLTPKASPAPKAPENPKVDAPTPPSRPEYFSRGQAFGAARKEAGGGEGKFSYDNKSYQTNVSSEPYKPEPQLKQTSVKEETTMNTKEHINEAIENVLENNLSGMKDNLLVALQEKAMEKLEERKKEIAANYFAE